jgi:hypothetical protein
MGQCCDCSKADEPASRLTKIVTSWPFSRRALARYKPMNAWPPPLVLTIRQLSALTRTAVRREALADSLARTGACIRACILQGLQGKSADASKSS